MFSLTSLTDEQKNICLNTISSNAFYMMVGDALDRGNSLSVIRMGDGESQLIKNCKIGDPDGVPDSPSHESGWLKRLGLEGISKKILQERISEAANNCTYFAPSVSGISNSLFNVYNFSVKRDRYIDNFFVNAWTEEMKIDLFKKAGHVLFIHRNAATADAMQIRAKYVLGVKVTYLKLDSWLDSERVINQSSEIDAPLVLFSAGPASKYIGPKISVSGNIGKVTLDIGNTADYWTLSSLREKADAVRFSNQKSKQFI